MATNNTVNPSFLENIKNQIGQAKIKVKRSLAAKNQYEVQDMALWNQHKAGDQQAKWELLKRFEPMISQHAGTHSNVQARSVVESQLKQMALKAFDTYDPGKNAKLSTHVMNSFKRLSRLNVKNQQAVRLPENIAYKFSDYTEAKDYLHEALGREPTNIELSDHLGWGVEDINKLSRRFHRELVESKQVFDPGVSDPDLSSSVITAAYYSMTPHEQYIFEHRTAYNGKEEKSAEQIRQDLKLSPHHFNKAMNSVVSKVEEARNVLERGE